MAALLHLRPIPGDLQAADAVARLNHVVQATLNRRQAARPMLVRRWTEATGGGLSCHWDIDVPLPPHPA